MSSQSSNSASTKYLLYVGTYGNGIYGAHYDASSGTLEPLSVMGELVNSSWVSTDPERKFLFAVSELEGTAKGDVASFKIDYATGKLQFLNKQSSDGLAPCHLAVESTGKMLVAANYTSGTVPSYPVESDGKTGKHGVP